MSYAAIHLEVNASLQMQPQEIINVYIQSLWSPGPPQKLSLIEGNSFHCDFCTENSYLF